MARHPDIDDATRARLIRETRRKTWEVNQALTEMLAGQRTTLATLKLPNERKPGETPLERLRRYFDTMVRMQQRSTTDELGLCVDCGAPIPVLALIEHPWRERCEPCEEAANAPWEVT